MQQRAAPWLYGAIAKEHVNHIGNIPARAKASLPITSDGWQFGGGGDLFPNLSWTDRPDMTGSLAPQKLQDAWVAIALAVGLEGDTRRRLGSSDLAALRITQARRVA